MQHNAFIDRAYIGIRIALNKVLRSYVLNGVFFSVRNSSSIEISWTYLKCIAPFTELT